MLRDEIKQYTNLTGEDGWHVPIMKVGAYLDGYNKGLEAFDKIREEIEQTFLDDGSMQEYTVEECLRIIDKYKTERRKKE